MKNKSLNGSQELRTHKERLEQANNVLNQETKFISMIEGGIQVQEMLLKKIESSDQPTDTVELTQESEKAPSKLNSKKP